MLKSIEQLIKEFNKNEIIYCHWKSNEHLDSALVGDTDLDVLFDYSQKTKIEIILAECGLKRFQSTPLMHYNAIEDFIGFDQNSAKIWHLHTHYRMTLGESHLKGYTITPWLKYILENRKQLETGIYVSSPEDELVLLLCRIALKLRWRDWNKRISKDDKKEINWLKDRIAEKEFESRVSKFIGKNGYIIIKKILSNKIEYKRCFLKLQKYLRKYLRNFTSYSKFNSYLTRTKRELFWAYGALKRKLGLNNYVANRRTSPSGGTVVAILGCDGAGKSTTISYLKKEFKKKIDTVTIYFGSGDGKSSLIRLPMKIIAKKVGGKGVGHKVEEEYQNKKRVSLKAKLYSFAKILWAISLAQEKQKKFKQMVKARNNGLLVLTDRYPQVVQEGYSDGPLLSRYLAKKGFLGKIAHWEHNVYNISTINPPDLIIKLMVPTEIAIARKPEMTTKEIEDKKAIINALDISEHSTVIDTSRDFNITIGEVMNEIWKII